MDNTLLTAIIAASSALLGSLIPTTITYLNSKRQNEFELRKALIEKQKGVYFELMQSLQDMINKQGNEEFLELQKSVIKVAVYGDLIINMPQPILRGDAAWAVSAPPPSPGAEAWRPGRIGD